MSDLYDSGVSVYSNKAEEDYWENGGYEADLEAREAARDIRESAIREGFLDALGFPRDSACRDCAWMKEAILDNAISEADDDYQVPEDFFDQARRMCDICRQHTPEERDDILTAFWKGEDEK